MANPKNENVQNWPVPDLPSNSQWDEYEYGVFLDNTEEGFGIALMEVTRDAHKAATVRRVYGAKAHVRQRRVVYSHWSGAFYDDGAPLTPPGSTTPDTPM